MNPIRRLLRFVAHLDRGERPERIAINHDDDHAKYVGRLDDGRQFFLAEPFRPALGDDPGCEYLALYTFDRSGRLFDARTQALGPRSELKQERVLAAKSRLLDSLGERASARIEVEPFAIVRHDTVFGLVANRPVGPDDEWMVTLVPGDYMFFHAPWDSGEYDT